MKYNFSFGIKTFNRPEHLVNLITSIREFYDNPIYIIDDGNLNADLSLECFAGVYYERLPFDSGVSVGRNRLAEVIREEYFLLMDDDWEVTKESNIHLMYRAISNLELDILGGQFIGIKGPNQYHGRLFEEDGELVLKNSFDIIKYRDTLDEASYDIRVLDVTSNFFMGKTESVRAIGWTPRFKIGGEHIDFFYRAKNIGASVGQIRECIMADAVKKIPVSKTYKEDYSKYRMRGQKNLSDFLSLNNFSKLNLWFK